MDKQFKMYSVNFRAFYTNEEIELNDNILEILNKLHSMEGYYKFISKYKVDINDMDYNTYLNNKSDKEYMSQYYKTNEEEYKKYRKKLRKMTSNERKLYKKFKLEEELKVAKDLAKEDENYKNLKEELKNKKKELVEKLIGYENNKPRKLRDDCLVKENIISVFDSSLSRAIGIECDTLEPTMDIICITISHYQVMEQIIKNGFIYKDSEGNDIKYRVFTSSAGQIRKKKIVFIKEDVWNKYEKTIMCGLSWDKINKQGGMNINKFLAYLALQNSATDEMTNFDIDKSIVIDDFETTLKNREVYYIEKIKKDDGNLVIKRPIRTNKDIDIAHTDGCGMCLKGNKSYQIRLPFVKGLMTPVNYIMFCEETKGATTKIKDLWGKEWDIKEDSIEYIFTKSQFKMWKYYKDWNEYKECFKKYNCKANYCNIEESNFREGRFNYQYWQTLSDIEDDEIEIFTKPIIEKVINSHDKPREMLDTLGANKDDKFLNIEQKILKRYPVLLKDYHFQDSLATKLSKIKKEAKSGKFKINSINTFILPDVYAWMENVFCGIKVPKGLLKDGEVSCKYFEKEKLLLDRSPHLGFEHCNRNNVTCDNCKEDDNRKELFKKYFITNGVYTSTYDLISKILQFDVDGDHASVTDNETIIKIVERNAEYKNIVPLYYEMGKAEAELITKESIIKSLKCAFKYSNIGMYSNKITNLWNIGKMDDDISDLIKMLVAQNNYAIDSAKTLEMVDFDDEEKNEFKDLIRIANGSMPYFFQFAKDKSPNSVSKINNSTVNRICKSIEDGCDKYYKYDFSKLGKLNTSFLYFKKPKQIDIENETAINFINKFEEVDNNKNILLINAKDNGKDLDKVFYNVYDVCKKEILQYINENKLSINECSDIITKYCFENSKNLKKSLLFNVFGEIILNNINRNLKDKKYGFCKECGERFDKKSVNSKQIYCDVCIKEKQKEWQKNSMKKMRNR